MTSAGCLAACYILVADLAASQLYDLATLCLWWTMAKVHNIIVFNDQIPRKKGKEKKLLKQTNINIGLKI